MMTVPEEYDVRHELKIKSNNGVTTSDYLSALGYITNKPRIKFNFVCQSGRMTQTSTAL